MPMKKIKALMAIASLLFNAPKLHSNSYFEKVSSEFKDTSWLLSKKEHSRGYSEQMEKIKSSYPNKMKLEEIEEKIKLKQKSKQKCFISALGTTFTLCLVATVNTKIPFKFTITRLYFEAQRLLVLLGISCILSELYMQLLNPLVSATNTQLPKESIAYLKGCLKAEQEFAKASKI